MQPATETVHLNEGTKSLQFELRVEALVDDRQNHNQENSCIIVEDVQPSTKAANVNEGITSSEMEPVEDDKQQDHNQDNSCMEDLQLSTTATHLNESVTSSQLDMEPVKDGKQDDNRENSCIIVDALLSSSTKATHQKEDTTSEFELGMIASSSTRQIVSDSPIKVPKVTEEFSQDTFSHLSVRGMDT